MEDENMILDEEEALDKSLDENERNKVKNKRINYTISEIQTALKYFEKCEHLRNTAKFFDVPLSTLATWVKKKMNTYQLKEKNLIID